MPFLMDVTTYSLPSSAFKIVGLYLILKLSFPPGRKFSFKLLRAGRVLGTAVMVSILQAQAN